MHQSILDAQELWRFPPQQRLVRCEEILKNEKDESIRWDAVWVAGEIADKRDKGDAICKRCCRLVSMGFKAR